MRNDKTLKNVLLHDQDFNFRFVSLLYVNVCIGAMLTMICATVLPEAFEKGGAVVGLAALAGFLIAFCVKAL